MAERGIGLDETAAGFHPPVRRDNAGDLRGEPHRLAVGRLLRFVPRLRIVLTERGRQRPQHVHAVVGRQLLHQPEDCLRQRTRSGELRLQVSQLRPARQAAVPQQVTDLLEGGTPGEVVDVVTVVREHAAIAIQVADG